MKSNYFWIKLFAKELKKLLGKFGNSFFLLFLIFLLSFVVIGFVKGTADLLNDNLQNPFLNWVPVIIPSKLDSKAISIVDTLNNNDSLKKRWEYKDVSLSKKVGLYLKQKNSEIPVHVTGITLQYNKNGDGLLKDIFTGEHCIRGTSFRSSKDYGAVVTDTLLKSLGYTDSTSNLFMFYFIPGKYDYLVRQIPIVGIVDQLPRNVDLVVTPYFSYLLNDDKTKPMNPFEDAKKCFRIFIDGGIDEYYQFDSIIHTVVEQFETRKGSLAPFRQDPVIDTMSFKKGVVLSYQFYPELSLVKQDSLYNLITNIPGLENKFHFFRYYNIENKIPPDTNYNYISYPSTLSINFVKLDSVYPFSRYLSKKYPGLKMTMKQVKDANNIVFISSIASMSEFFLILFSVLIISLLINSMLRFHLHNMRANLGTFMAFGVSSRTLTILYLVIFLLFLSAASLVAYGVALMFGNELAILMVRFLLLIFTDVDAGNNIEIGFNLLNSYLIIEWISVIVFGLIYAWLIIWRYLDKNPGDLIYNRVK